MNKHIANLKAKLDKPYQPEIIIQNSKAVEAIDESDLDQFTLYLSFNSNTIYLDIWKLAANTALRISDLLNLKIIDCANKDVIHILESKTSNTRNNRTYRKITLNSTAKEVIARRIRLYPNDTYLFESKHTNASSNKPISRQSVWTAFSKAGKACGLHIGTHSSRKTLGAKLYRAGVPIATIQKLLKHSSESITLQYIGITQANVDQCYLDYEIN